MGCTSECFQDHGKNTSVLRIKWNNILVIGDNLYAHSRRIRSGTPFAPYALESLYISFQKELTPHLDNPLSLDVVYFVKLRSKYNTIIQLQRLLDRKLVKSISTFIWGH